ncbi:MAG: WYL domain-containing protein [Clostridia bacterium]|nr:WYL domain-containing protein [Clostridia bacterium]
MASGERKGDNQKLKMLYLAKIFTEETDDTHSLTMHDIISKLSAYGVNADRKTLYLDFEELRRFGYDILTERAGREHFYHLGAREFELAELKLLVDSVQSAKFITDKKSKELIKKLESLASRHEGRKLQRQVFISGRIKTMNESIYYNVDKLHEAINNGVQIRFQYFRWNEKKKQELRRNGEWYRVSPWSLMWDDENYYLVAYDAREDKIKHYRVDKMIKIHVTGDAREGVERFRDFNAPRYTKRLFGMFSGEETDVTIEAENDMAGIFIDRFGKDIFIVPEGGERFRTTVSVALSPQFLGWIIALGRRVRIISPDSAVSMMKETLKTLGEHYGA